MVLRAFPFVSAALLDKIHYRVQTTGRAMTSGLIPVPQTTLTPAQYGELADVPPEFERLANITNPKD
jgi:hypothetical protein